MWPLLIASGAVLAYEKAGDWINEARGVAVQPVTPPGQAPGYGGLLIIGAAIVGAAWLLRGKK